MAKETPLGSLGDAELILRMREDVASSSKCFEVIYNRYYRKVLDRCYSLSRNRALAEELAEDVFSKVFEKLPSFRLRSSFSSWLYAVTYNHCIDHLREQKKLHYPKWDSENQLPEIIDETGEDLGNINYDNLMKVLDMIHTEEKALLLMKYKDELTIKEISRALRISEDATKMRLKRARARVLFIYMEKYMRG